MHTNIVQYIKIQLLFTDEDLPIWSSPVDVDCSSIDQLVNLPGFTKGIKVHVENHPHSTLITIEDVTQVCTQLNFGFFLFFVNIEKYIYYVLCKLI